jgi:hypothetical protein
MHVKYSSLAYSMILLQKIIHKKKGYGILDFHPMTRFELWWKRTDFLVCNCNTRNNLRVYVYSHNRSYSRIPTNIQRLKTLKTTTLLAPSCEYETLSTTLTKGLGRLGVLRTQCWSEYFDMQNIVTCRVFCAWRILDWMIGFIAPYTFTTRNYRQYSAVADLHT